MAERITLATMLDPRQGPPYDAAWTLEVSALASRLARQAQVEREPTGTGTGTGTGGGTPKPDTLALLGMLNAWLAHAANGTDPAWPWTCPAVELPAGTCARFGGPGGDVRPGPDDLRPVLDVARSECYYPVKVLRTTLYGDVVHCVVGTLSADGLIDIPASPARFAVKRFFSKENVRARRLANGMTTLEDPVREIRVQQALASPGSDRVLCVKCVLESPNSLFMVLPFLGGGELFDVVQEQGGRFSEARTRELVRHMAEGIAYMHERGFAHRDVSLENTMLTDDGSAVIIDFGMACSVDRDPRPGREGRFLPNTPRTGLVGKLPYIPYEVFHGRDPYDATAMDVWCLGVVCFRLLTGCVLYESPQVRFFPEVHRGQFLALFQAWHKQAPDRFSLSPAALNFVDGLLRGAPADRPSMQAVLGHPFLSPPSSS